MNEENEVARAMLKIAEAITPLNALPYAAPNGDQVGTLTEAVLHAAAGLHDIAAAINRLADAVEGEQ